MESALHAIAQADDQAVLLARLIAMHKQIDEWERNFKPHGVGVPSPLYALHKQLQSIAPHLSFGQLPTYVANKLSSAPTAPVNAYSLAASLPLRIALLNLGRPSIAAVQSIDMQAAHYNKLQARVQAAPHQLFTRNHAVDSWMALRLI